MIDLIVLSAIVVGLTQLVKMTININPRYIPMSALIITFGILILYCRLEGIAFNWQMVKDGFMVALGSVGLWSGTKATLGV